MLRRKFVQLSSATGLSTLFARNIGTIPLLKETPYKNSLGLQLWTVRRLLQQDAKGTLKAIKDAGYKQVELMRLDQLDDLGPIASDLGLEIHCSHINNKVVSGNWKKLGQPNPNLSKEELIDKATKYDLSHLTFGYWSAPERQTLDDYKLLANELNVFGELCNSADINFSYHNHSFEFKPIGESHGFEILLDKVDPDKMKYELDVFWASIGGVEPVGLMHKIKDRLALLHLKDLAKNSDLEYDEGNVPKAAFQEVGDGKIDFQGIIDAALEYDVDYCHVEQDESPDPIMSIGKSRKYLFSL